MVKESTALKNSEQEVNYAKTNKITKRKYLLSCRPFIVNKIFPQTMGFNSDNEKL